MKISDAKLAELEALEKAATKGEWVSRDKRVEIRWVAFAGECLANPRFHSDEDAAFIAALRNSASDLIADLREARAWVAARDKLVHSQALEREALVAELISLRLRTVDVEMRARAEKAEDERDAYRKAKQENDERATIAALDADYGVLKAGSDRLEIERDRLREAAKQLRGVLAPLLKDYCELHDNEVKHELFVDPAESALDTTSWVDALEGP